MQILIDIPDEKYDRLMKQMALDRNFSECDIIELPKGHGAIVDLKQVIRVEIEEPHTGKNMVWNNNPKINDITWHIVTPTIIEADNAESEEV